MERARGRAGTVVVRLAEVADRDAARALCGARLYVGRDRLPPPAEGEYYHADLIGLRVERPGGEVVGTVTAVPNYGAGDLLCIARAGGGQALVPFAAAYVTEVDVAGGRIVADPPAALLDPAGGG